MKRVLLFIVLMLMLLPVTPIYAIDEPDSIPVVQKIDIYRNLREAGDQLILIYANIPYAALPDVPVSDAFYWKLMAMDGVTELGVTTGYAYNDFGYGWNLYSMYFAAADNWTWGLEYGIKLAGNPIEFPGGYEKSYAIATSDYTSYTSQADNQDALQVRLIAIANDLDSRWALASSLLYQSEAGQKLSADGEAFFRGAIFGLQSLCPGIFNVALTNLDIADRVWDEEYSENVTGQYAGTWIGTSKAAGAALFGGTTDMATIMLVLIGGILLVVGTVLLTGSYWAGLIVIGFFMIVTGRLGLYPLGFLALIGALSIIYTGFKVFKPA